MSLKKDIRLQVFVTSQMDDRLDDMCSIMGMHKNEIVRVAIAQYVGAWGQSVELIKDMISSGSSLSDIQTMFEKLKK